MGETNSICGKQQYLMQKVTQNDVTFKLVMCPLFSKAGISVHSRSVVLTF